MYTFAKNVAYKTIRITGVIIDEANNEDDSEILKKIEERNEAKKNKDYELADKIRNELLEKGIILKDTREGTIYSRQ